MIYTQNLTATHPIVDIILTKFSAQYRKQKADAAQAAQTAAWDARVTEAKEQNKMLLMSILHNCPEGHIVVIDFPCGNWHPDNIAKEVPHLVEVASNPNSPWAYLHGAGVIAINPDRYKHDPAKIAEAIWEPTLFLKGGRIQRWKYFEKVT